MASIGERRAQIKDSNKTVQRERERDYSRTERREEETSSSPLCAAAHSLSGPSAAV